MATTFCSIAMTFSILFRPDSAAKNQKKHRVVSSQPWKKNEPTLLYLQPPLHSDFQNRFARIQRVAERRNPGMLFIDAPTFLCRLPHNLLQGLP